MKTILHVFSLITVSGYAAAQLAETAGLRLPASVTATNAVTLLLFAFVGLLLLADYGAAGARRPGLVRRRSVVNTRHGRAHGYSIRRGAEAARLAVPTATVRFPSAPRVRSERVA